VSKDRGNKNSVERALGYEAIIKLRFWIYSQSPKVKKAIFVFLNNWIRFKTKFMQNSLKIILLVVGLALIGFGLYTIFTPDTVFEAGPISLKAKNNTIDTQSIVIIGLGVIALIGAVFSKKK